jgi:glycosyltransferase involved in cell wall biosynthesis
VLESCDRVSIRVVCVNDVAFVATSLTAELNRRGFEMMLTGRGPSDPSTPRDGLVSNIVRIVRSILRDKPHDLLHINYGLYAPVRLLDGCPTILHLHGSDIRPADNFQGRLANLVSAFGTHLVDRVWYSTPDLAGYVHETDIPVRFMPNPVGPDFFDLPIIQRPVPSVLLAVPLSELKGAETAMDAVRLIHEVRPEIAVQAFNFGPDPHETSRIRQTIPDWVGRLPWTPHAGIPGRIGRADIVIGQLRLGILSNLELEAMAAGKPLICRFSRAQMDRENYYKTNPPLLNATSAAEVAAFVLDLVDDPSRRSLLGEAARRWSNRYHSVPAVAAEYAHEYHELAGGA